MVVARFGTPNIVRTKNLVHMLRKFKQFARVLTEGFLDVGDGVIILEHVNLIDVSECLGT